MDDSLAREIVEMEIPLVESPLLQRWLEKSDTPPSAREKLLEYAERGYVTIDLDLDGFDELAARTIATLAPRYPEKDRRVMEAWYFEDAVRRIALSEAVLDHLRLFYQREPIPFQTLNFDVGTEQAAHSDTLHFHCAPRRFMAGAWVALEDIHPDSGALAVYPGSHRLPDYDMHDFGLRSSPEDYGRYETYVREILAAGGYKPEIVCPRKGQAILWAANLFHGGSPRTNPRRTRHSQVTHYYFEKCLYYFPMASDPFVRRICMREVIDLRTLQFVTHSYGGKALDLKDYIENVAYPRPLPAAVHETTKPAPPPAPSDPADAAARIADLTELRDLLYAKIELMNGDREEAFQLTGTWSDLPRRFVHGVRKTLRAWRMERKLRR